MKIIYKLIPYLISAGFLFAIIYLPYKHFEDEKAQKHQAKVDNVEFLGEAYVYGDCSEYHTEISANYFGTLRNIKFRDTGIVSTRSTLRDAIEKDFAKDFQEGMEAMSKSSKDYLKHVGKYHLPDIIDIDITPAVNLNDDKFKLYGIAHKYFYVDGNEVGSRMNHYTECNVERISKEKYKSLSTKYL